MSARGPEQLAREIANDPRERMVLAGIRQISGLRPSCEQEMPPAEFLDTEMRTVLDQDEVLHRVPTEVLRRRGRTSYFVQLRLRVVRLLHPRFTDDQIGHFLHRDRATITYLRRNHA